MDGSFPFPGAVRYLAYQASNSYANYKNHEKNAILETIFLAENRIVAFLDILGRRYLQQVEFSWRCSEVLWYYSYLISASCDLK